MPLAPLLVALALALDDAPGPRAPGAVAEVIRAQYQVDLVGRSRATFALPPGPRTIRAFRFVPEPGAPDSWRSARLRLVWDADDPDAAAVDLPLGLFVAAEAGAASAGADTPRLVNRRAMPYRRGGRLVLDADGPVRGSIRLDAAPAGPEPHGPGYLHARLDDGPDGPAGPGTPRPSAEFSGNGAGGPRPPVRYWYDRHPAPPPGGGPG